MQLWLPCHMIHEITFGPSFEVAFISRVKLNHYLLNTKGGLLYCDSKIIRINSMLIVKIEREKEYGITRHHFADELYTKSLIKHDYLILLFYREECQRAWFESRNCYLNFPKICFHPNLIISHGFICLLCLYLSFQLVSSGDSLHELGMLLLGSEFHYKLIGGWTGTVILMTPLSYTTSCWIDLCIPQLCFADVFWAEEWLASWEIEALICPLICIITMILKNIVQIWVIIIIPYNGAECANKRAVREEN